MNDKENILEELKNGSPTLYALKQANHNPFKTPEGYFEVLKQEVFASIELGFSDDIGKELFSVPDNYFKNLSGNIMDAIEAEEAIENEIPEIKGKVIDIQSARNRAKTPKKVWYTMVASIAAAVLFVVYLGGIFGKMDGGVTDPEIAKADVIDYIQDNSNEFESEDIFALVDLSEENLELDLSIEFGEELEEYLEDNIDAFDEYLLTNEI